MAAKKKAKKQDKKAAGCDGKACGGYGPIPAGRSTVACASCGQPTNVIKTKE